MKHVLATGLALSGLLGLALTSAIPVHTVQAADNGIGCTSACITEYGVAASPSGGPFGLATGPDHALWFGHGDTIGRLTLDGQETEFPVPTANPLNGWVTEGPDGAMWFVERFGNKIGRITTTGQVTEYPIPTTVPDENGNPGTSLPQAVVAGPDGALWFTEVLGNKIGRLTLGGHITEYPVPTEGAGPQGLAVGPDGALWFTERFASQIGRITLDGHFTEYPLAPGVSPQRIVAGKDGAMWFTELRGNTVAKITMNGTITEYAVGGGPVGITAGPDGSLWIVEFLANAIGRVAYSGKLLAEYPISTAGSGTLQITVGPDGNPWFGESLANMVGRVQALPPRPASQGVAASPSFAVASFSSAPRQRNVYVGSGPRKPM